MRRANAAIAAIVVGDQAMRRCLVPVAIVFVIAFALNRQASAGCGDYVMVGGADAHGMPHSSRAGSNGVPTCSGPHCQRPAPLPPAPKQLVQNGPQESALSLIIVGSEPNDQSALVTNCVLLTSQAVPRPPDRPPRASLLRQPDVGAHL